MHGFGAEEQSNADTRVPLDIISGFPVCLGSKRHTHGYGFARMDGCTARAFGWDWSACLFTFVYFYFSAMGGWVFLNVD